MRVLIVLSLLITMTKTKIQPLSCSGIQSIVDRHNKFRLQVAKGLLSGQPPAQNMSVITWDPELAKKAADWAEQMKFEHNSDTKLKSGRFETGENMFYYSSVDKCVDVMKLAMEAWTAESKYFSYCKPNYDRNSHRYTGRFTQMVWSNTTHIGCAMSAKPDKTKFASPYTNYLVVCYYAPAGNLLGVRPYKSGKPLSKLSCSMDACSCKNKYGKACSEGGDEDCENKNNKPCNAGGDKKIVE